MTSRPLTIEIDDELLAQAEIYGLIENISPTQKLEHWIKTGKMAQENPDLTYQDITELLIALSQVKAKMTTPYTFG